MSTEHHFIRLCAHWPALGGDDATAQVRARDWLNALRIMGDEAAGRAVEQLIQTSARVPRIADLRDAAEASVRLDGPAFVDTRPKALPEPDLGQERLTELVGQARGHLHGVPAPSGERSRPKHPPKGPTRQQRRERIEAAYEAQHQVMLTYAEVYDEQDRPRPEYETEADAWSRFRPGSQ